jgi:DNA-binding NarL/FixJ family response regulator
MTEAVSGREEGVVQMPTAIVVADMFFASKGRGTATAAGVRAIVRGRPEGIADRVRAEAARLVIVDLELRFGDAVAAVRELKADADTRSVPIVAFSSHTNAGVIAEARAAGADRVMARSAFVQELPSLMQSLAAGSSVVSTES